MPRKATTRLEDSSQRYSVYVIELRDAVCKKRECQARAAGKTHVYVGETGKTPEERFADHKAGGRTSRREPREYGIKLRPDLHVNWGPYAKRARARQAEARLADRLRAARYHVYGGR
jgi:hypothetical protein